MDVTTFAVSLRVTLLYVLGPVNARRVEARASKCPRVSRCIAVGGALECRGQRINHARPRLHTPLSLNDSADGHPFLLARRASSQQACAALNSQAAIAACACSAQTIGDVRSCASCISQDRRTSRGNSTAVVGYYNCARNELYLEVLMGADANRFMHVRTAYVDLCTSEGLATVTGTIAVGASTSALPRTPLPSAPSSVSASASVPPESRSTFNPSATTTTSVALVPSLLESTSASGGAASASGFQVTPGVGGIGFQPSSGATRTGTIGFDVLAAAVVAAVVAVFA